MFSRQNNELFGEYIFISTCTELFYKNGVLKNFAKFGKHLSQNLEASNLQRLLLYITRLIPSWRKVCLKAICCSCILFNFIKTRDKKMLLIRLKIQNEIRYDFSTICYSLGSPCCFIVADHFCDKNTSRIFILHLAFFEYKPRVRERQYSFVKNFIAKKRYICIIIYILYACFGIPLKTLPESYE